MDAEDVLARIRRLVDDGEYLDELYGRPGENLEGATVLRLGPRAWSFRSARRSQRDPGPSTARRTYRRGSRAHLEAKAAGLIDPLPPLVPASPSTVAAAERSMGARFPTLLRRLYLEIGNGGFGPGYGILGLEGGFTLGAAQNAVDSAAHYRDAAPGSGPLLPICEWGCAIVSLVELDTTDGRIWGDDPNCAPPGFSTYCQEIGLVEWLARWVDGRLYQPAVIEYPDGHYRGATMEELEAWAADLDSP